MLRCFPLEPNYELHSSSDTAKRDKQETIVGLLLTTTDDGGRSQVLSTVSNAVNNDSRLLITLSVQLCVQHKGDWA